MNLTDYEKKYFLIYESFAETVRFILKKALLATDNLPLPQSIQCRAKGINSLRVRLFEEGKLDTQTLELERRDLAGARLIFYTNNDVDRFLASPLIRENFQIEEDRRGEADRYIDEIDAENENDWFDLIARCAETEPNDLTTFPVLGSFISKLAERKPEVAERFLEKASEELLNFLAGFLKGLALSGQTDIYERILESELEFARNLPGVARHLRISAAPDIEPYRRSIFHHFGRSIVGFLTRIEF